jgi:hypothetical protein
MTSTFPIVDPDTFIVSRDGAICNSPRRGLRNPALGHGDPDAASRLLPLVYDELRTPGHCAVGERHV